jgi:hypothetical protein
VSVEARGRRQLTSSGNQKQRPPTEPVHLHGRRHGDDDVQNGLAGAQAQLLVLAGDAGALVDGVHVVGEQRVTRVLRDDAQRDDDGQPPQVALGLEKVQVAALLAGLLLQADRLADLAVLELHRRVVDVAAAVVLGQNVQGLLVAFLGDQVTGGLGDP